MFGGRELPLAARLLESALKHGITHFDTAPAYGSEAVLGTVLAGCAVTITTKVGLPRYQASSSTARRVLGPLYRRTARGLLSRMPGLKARLLKAAAAPVQSNVMPRRRLGRGEVLAELEVSLKQLRRSSIDLYLLHEPNSIELTDELECVFAELKHAGIIKAYGLAFGGGASAVAFGTVVQARAPIELRERPGELLCISHGIIRGASERKGIPALMADTLRSSPGRAVIFSASSPHQIRHIATECDGGPVSPS
jgi:aryl-alcohol dehydrogenase-like predicted oxidoreductase